MAEYCEMSDLPIDQCGLPCCTPPAPAPATPTSSGFRRGGGIAAKYPSRCPACGDDIEVDDLITETDNGYIHKECA